MWVIIIIAAIVIFIIVGSRKKINNSNTNESCERNRSFERDMNVLRSMSESELDELRFNISMAVTALAMNGDGNNQLTYDTPLLRPIKGVEYIKTYGQLEELETAIYLLRGHY